MPSQDVSLIVTVLNEAKTIIELLVSIQTQTFSPTEIIIVDGGSADGTQKLIQEFCEKNPSLNIIFKTKLGNRSIGRNFAIQLAKSAWIAITDAGCILEPNWLAELVKKHQISQADVVAGYYRGVAKSKFQLALIPYVLVMPDKLPKTESDLFLPATRSMLMLKSAWQKVYGFNEGLSDNEDFDFANKLVLAHLKLSFTATAIVNWRPPQNLATAVKMFFRFSRGDSQARIHRPKVDLIFGRYFLLGLMTLILARNPWLGIFWLVSLMSYSLWAIKKNYGYAQTGWVWLPIIQICSDLAVMSGTVMGYFKRVSD